MNKSTSRLSDLYRQLQASEDKPYPIWICWDCGDRYGNRAFGEATWHVDNCGVCGEMKACTEPRDCGYLKDGWEENENR